MSTVDHTEETGLSKILFATDFSPVAKMAAEYTRGLAQQFGARVVQAHVVAPELFLDPSQEAEYAFDEDPHQWRAKEIEKFDEQMIAGGVGFSTRISTEYPVWNGILELIAEESPDLLVMGTESKSVLERLTIGSVADHVIRNATCPVLTIGPHALSPENEPLLFSNILIATDFSPASLKAAQYAAMLSMNRSARLHLIHVRAAHKDKESVASTMYGFQSALKQLLPPEVYDGCRWEELDEDKNVAETIGAIAAAIHADLLVLGVRKSSFWLTRVQRGVTTNLLAKTACPLLTMC